MSREKDSSLQPLNPANHLKPETIWHTVSRDEESLDYDERYPSKKRRVSSGIEIVKCNICGHHFDSPNQLSDHLLHHDNDYRYNPIYKCSYGQCLFRTDDRSLMKHHISRVHLKSDQALISKRYRNRRFLRPTILCNTCPMVFATEAELWQHTPSCKEYRCQFCGQHFWTVEKRYSHELTYHEDEFEYEEEAEEEENITKDVIGDEVTTAMDNSDDTNPLDEAAPLDNDPYPHGDALGPHGDEISPLGDNPDPHGDDHVTLSDDVITLSDDVITLSDDVITLGNDVVTLGEEITREVSGDAHKGGEKEEVKQKEED